MNENNNRRDVLKLVTTASIGSVSFSLPTSAAEDQEKSGNIIHTLPYDLKIRNSGTESFNTVVQLYKKGGRDTPTAEYQSSKVEKIGRSEEQSLAIKSGNYTVQATAIFEDGSSVTAKRELTVPKGGIPDYAGILVSVFSKNEVRVTKVEV